MRPWFRGQGESSRSFRVRLRPLARRALVSILLVAASPVFARTDDDDGSKQLTRLTLEELADLKVVSVSKREESNLEAPAAVHVISAEDIRRTGSVSLPDAFRTAPGLQASKIDADEWALSIRGYPSRVSRSILAVIDGRSVWTPLYAGIFWDMQDTVLEDVEQIEVSRGPGGATYGANALNGVINITTRAAKDTQGGLASLGLGTEDQQGAFRYGGKSGDNVFYRVFAKYAERDGTTPLTAAGYDDTWKLGLGGFRLDWERDAANHFTFSGDAQRGHASQSTTIPYFTAPFQRTVLGKAEFGGANLLGRWKRMFENGGELRVQTYFDHTNRDESHYSERRNTIDFDSQFHAPRRGIHDLVFGASYRRSAGDFPGTPVLRFVPAKRNDDLFGVFANDEMRFLDDRLRVTLGTKIEWNDYAGWNTQPSARAAWASKRHLFWGSLTRALRTSSRLEEGVVLYSALSATQPLFAKTTGSDDFAPEKVTAIEGGYKLRLPRVLLTVSAFRNAYHGLAASLPGGPAFTEGGADGEPVRTVTPIVIGNGPAGRTTGLEAKVVVSAASNLRVQAAYSYLKVFLEGEVRRAIPTSSPRHQFWLTAYWTPVPKVDVDILFRSIGSLAVQQVPRFSEIDARLGFRPRETLEVAIVGSSLLHSSHQEFGGGFAVDRSVRVQATARF
jgi:iron complex outermembrane receptor protein